MNILGGWISSLSMTFTFRGVSPGLGNLVGASLEYDSPEAIVIQWYKRATCCVW